ncbi:hypothetical protein DSECCO2_307060 [anaerobic digester metagenome]
MITGATGIGLTVTARVDVFPLPHVFCGVTVISPESAVVEKSTVMVLVPVPATTVAPVGTVHWYAVAPLTGLIE